MEKVRASFTHQNTTSAAVLIPDTMDDGARCGTRNKEDLYIMIKHFVQQGVIILNLYVTNKNLNMCFLNFWNYGLTPKRNRQIPDIMDLTIDHWIHNNWTVKVYETFMQTDHMIGPKEKLHTF